MSDSRPGIDLVVQLKSRTSMLPFHSQTIVSRNLVRLAAEPAASPRHNLTQTSPFHSCGCIRLETLARYSSQTGGGCAPPTTPQRHSQHLVYLPGKPHGCSCDVKRWPRLLVTLLRRCVHSFPRLQPHVLTSGFCTVFTRLLSQI